MTAGGGAGSSRAGWAGRLGGGVVGAAVLIGVITILARVTGFAKQLAFARSVGTNCLASAYYTANHVPNIVFEVVAGGALAGMVVPVLAGPAARAMGESREEASRIASALMTWVLVLLVPLGALTALAAGPLARLLVGGAVPDCEAGQVAAVAGRMLAVFAPQIPLYGMAVVLYGVLQAHRRFAGPALAPLVSSVVVIVAYLAFTPLSGGDRDPAAVPAAAQTVLSVGTTLGVLALVVTVIGPGLGLGLRWRPVLRFPDGVGAQVRRLALAGLSALLAQQAVMAMVIPLANRVGGGALPAYDYAWAIYQVPYAVLAVPIATSAFPVLSAHAENGDHDGFAELSARTTRAVILICGLAAGALAAVAGPVAHVFLGQADADVRPDEFARAIALFAPGLVGYGLTAHLSRVLYAADRGRAAARGMVAGWLVAGVAQAAFVLLLPAGWKLGGLAAGQALGMTAGGALLLGSVLRARGGAAVRGVRRAAPAAALGGGAGFLAGSGAVLAVGGEGPWAGLAAAAVAGVTALLAGVIVAAAADREDLDVIVARFRRGRASEPDGRVLSRRGGGRP
ncbi:virulence factor MviN [Microbispora sp. RL4-1S]|uniref:Virulence factor MviN n=1 Tax=Microbispora oryzae TaxID=2806554 RepID=A0A940WG68_9ACTN|nr:lipid II flippase MurJ [Microbispora oryzae]MBP2703457.1 virulence factor MviN [Microbispora oryzae]